MQAFPLSEGEFTIGFDKIFRPFNPETDELLDRPRGSLLVEVQPFLVVHGKDVMVLDTGLGFHGSSGQLQIYEALARHGYQPSDVTRVLLSHLHKDHAGGLLYEDDYGVMHPSFPKAIHSIRRSEWDYAFDVGYPSYHPDEFGSLEQKVTIDWLEGSEGTITPGISWEHSGGHCPQHIVFTLSEGGESLFFGGDEAPQLKQMKMKYVAKYDWNGQRAMQLREEYGERGRKHNWQFLFYHDIKSPIAKL
jgi:glyoxylase-like metal-dependent hydrolase (beta-lactamase superfamily II)